MKSNTSAPLPQPAKRKTLTVMAVALIAVAVIAVVAFMLSPANPWRNYAEEIAKPLEQALIAHGAVKKCSNGDPGRGPSNKEPNYSSEFQLNVGKDEATKIITKVASEHGFTLSHADSPYESIEWYSDKTSKDSTYPDLEAGKVKLSISTYNNTSKQALGCLDGTALLGDETHTGVSLSVVLPLRKP